MADYFTLRVYRAGRQATITVWAEDRDDAVNVAADLAADDALIAWETTDWGTMGRSYWQNVASEAQQAIDTATTKLHWAQAELGELDYP